MLISGKVVKMEKAYTRTYWLDDSEPYIEAENLNNIEKGIDTIDDRVVSMDEKVTEAYNNSASALNGISVIQGTYAKKTDLPNIATSENVGLVKPDGSTTYIDADGTLHAVGGGGGGTGGTSNYNDLMNKPSINGVTLQGKKTLEDLGVDALAEEKVSDLHEDTLGGFTPVIDSTGKITGYKTKAGADTVFPFSKSNKFVNLNVIMSTNGSAARPTSYATRNDTNAEYFGDFETGSDKNTATMTIKKSGTYKILFRTAYRVTQSNCSLKHNDTYIAQNVSGNSEVTEYEINANAGDTIILGITNKTSGYGFQCADVIVYPA